MDLISLTLDLKTLGTLIGTIIATIIIILLRQSRPQFKPTADKPILEFHQENNG